MAVDKYPYPCFSAGHGWESRREGASDSGANIVTIDADEDDFNLSISKRMVANFEVLFSGTHGKVMLRNGGKYYKADDEAYARGCDLFFESHLNSIANRRVSGTEVIRERSDSRTVKLATNLSSGIAGGLRITDRGPKHRDDLAVTNPHPGMISVLVEWFFASNKSDVQAWRNYGDRAELAAVNAILEHYGWRTVTSLPRKWSKLRRKMYKPY